MRCDTCSYTQDVCIVHSVPRESLKRGGKVVRPAKVKNLVVETRDVIASFRQVEDLRRERERERERESL